MNASGDAGAPLRWRVAGSLLSALAGWLAMTLSLYVESLFQAEDEAYWWSLYPVVCAPVIVVVWLAALLPLCLRTPMYSALWRWPVCTLCGATAGTCISLVVFGVFDPSGVVSRFADFLVASLRLAVFAAEPPAFLAR